MFHFNTNKITSLSKYKTLRDTTFTDSGHIVLTTGNSNDESNAVNAALLQGKDGNFYLDYRNATHKEHTHYTSDIPDISDNYISKYGDVMFGSFIIEGDLSVKGSQTTINTTELNVDDNIVTLNTGAITDTPTINAGLEVFRGGTEPNVGIIWDEYMNRWTLSDDGFSYNPILTTFLKDDMVINSVNGEYYAIRRNIDDTTTRDFRLRLSRTGDLALELVDNGAEEPLASLYGSALGTLKWNNEIIWHTGNDGPGSTLNADLLDNLDSSDFYRTSFENVTDFDLAINEGQYNVNSSTSILHAPFTGSIVGILNVYVSGGKQTSGTSTIWQLLKLTTGIVYSRFKSGASAWSVWAQHWTSKNQGAGSGLDADTIQTVPLSDLMQVSVYDTNKNGQVDLADVSENALNSYKIQNIQCHADNVNPTGTARLNMECVLYATRIYNAQYNDVAEAFPIKDPQANAATYYVNRIMMINENGCVELASECAENTVGIVSDTYAYVMGSELDFTNGEFVPIAMSGTVWVDAQSKPDKSWIGKYIVSAGDGYACCIDDPKEYVGCIVGKVVNIDDINRYNQVKVLVVNM